MNANEHVCLRISPRRAARAAALIMYARFTGNSIVPAQQRLQTGPHCGMCGTPGTTCHKHRIYTDWEGNVLPYGVPP